MVKGGVKLEAKNSLLLVAQVDNIQFIVGVLGCSVDSFPTSYLFLLPIWVPPS